MGFNKVYKALQEVFPQVDHRALRAVAIEHSKDADAAVEVVLIEVIPFLMEKSQAPSSSSERSTIKPPEVDASAIAQTADGFLMNTGASDEEQNGSTIYDADVGGLDENQNGYQIYDANTGGGLDEEQYGSSTYDADAGGSDEEQNGSSIYDANAGDLYYVPDADAGHDQLLAEGIGDHIQVNGECASGETVLHEKSQDQTSNLNTSSLEDLSTLLSQKFIAPHSILGGSDESFSLCNASEIQKDGDQDKSNVCNASEIQKDGDQDKSNVSLGQVTSLSTQDTMLTSEGCGELILVPDPHDSQPSCSINAASKEDSISEMVNIEDKSTLNTIVTRSGQICSVDLLEGIIEDARSYKGTLSSAKESLISLMREVEIQERAAEEAKEAVAKGGLDILNNVEDLKKWLQHAKEANDTHAGEVYGERAILGTEVRELQSRLFSLSEERDKSLAILDEMHQTLALRLAAAEEERDVAEKEILAKKESARKALAEQELIMEKVVQEANMLRQVAEENAKLRAFLDERGRVVDMLQGEISVICQDVSLLKGKLDERVPFSKFLSSSQSTYILASSGSSFKSMTPDQVDQVPGQSDSLENQKKTDSVPRLTEQLSSAESTDDEPIDQVPGQFDSSEDQKKIDSLPRPSEQLSSGEPTDEDVHKALLDAGWEIFENGDYM